MIKAAQNKDRQSAFLSLLKLLYGLPCWLDKLIKTFITQIPEPWDLFSFELSLDSLAMFFDVGSCDFPAVFRQAFILYEHSSLQV